MNITQGALVGKRLGKYEILALLAVGGTAEIYLARIDGEAGFEKYVVIKCLLDHLADETEYVRMFLDEARLGAQLDHSNIVQTLELGEKEGRYYMAMEYLTGMSLAQLARKTNLQVAGGRLPPQLVLGLAAQVCAGLHYAHRKLTADGTPLNLVHRDISPQNLVVSFEGILKIVDFGIAKADVRDTHTRSGTIKGKFAYMSPEQCLAKNVDMRTDVFALGVIIHELLTARRLFKRTTTYDTYEAIIKGVVPRPSEVAPDLGTGFDDLVMHALAYRKEDRYASAEELGQALLEVLHKQGTAVNASDIASFYEKHFGADLAEHAERMRLLITGKQRVVGDESINWDSQEIDGQPDEVSEIAIDLEGSMVESIESIESPPTYDSLPSVDTGDDQDTLPPGVEAATRIEVNPMRHLPSLTGTASVDAADATQIQPETTDPNPRPSGPAGKTIAPGGGVPVAKRSATPIASPGNPMTAGPSEKTIAPGQLSAASLPSILAPRPLGKEAARLASSQTGAVHGEVKPRKTVMGVSAAELLGPAKKPDAQSVASMRTLYQAPPSPDGPAAQPPSPVAPHGTPPGSTPLPPMAPKPPSSAEGFSPAPSASPAGGPGQGPHPQYPQAPPQASGNLGAPAPPDTLPPNAASLAQPPGFGPPPHGQPGPQQGHAPQGHGPQGPQGPQGYAPQGQPPQGPQAYAPQGQPQGPYAHAPRNRIPETHRVRNFQGRSLQAEPWFLGLVFAVALGVGLGVTLIIASL